MCVCVGSSDKKCVLVERKSFTIFFLFPLFLLPSPSGWWYRLRSQVKEKRWVLRREFWDRRRRLLLAQAEDPAGWKAHCVENRKDSQGPDPQRGRKLESGAASSWCHTQDNEERELRCYSVTLHQLRWTRIMRGKMYFPPNLNPVPQ